MEFIKTTEHRTNSGRPFYSVLADDGVIKRTGIGPTIEKAKEAAIMRMTPSQK